MPTVRPEALELEDHTKIGQIDNDTVLALVMPVDSVQDTEVILVSIDDYTGRCMTSFIWTAYRTACLLKWELKTLSA